MKVVVIKSPRFFTGLLRMIFKIKKFHLQNKIISKKTCNLFIVLSYLFYIFFLMCGVLFDIFQCNLRFFWLLHGEIRDFLPVCTNKPLAFFENGGVVFLVGKKCGKKSVHMDRNFEIANKLTPLVNEIIMACTLIFEFCVFVKFAVDGK